MLRYLVGRLGTTLLILLGAVVLLFSLTWLVPGDPAATLLGPRASPEAVADFRQRLGLDRPPPVQLVRFLGRVAQGDLGADVISGRPIADMVLEVLPYTLTLTALSIGLAALLGIPLGCFAATHAGTLADRVLAVASVALIAVPSYVVAIFLLLIFALWLGWLPALGVGDTGDLVGQAARLVLPTAALALGWIGYIARLMRASLLEVLGEPFIRTMRAYGVSEHRILYRHALKNAFIPTLAVLGLGVGKLLGGAIFIEIIFARPGIGKLVYDALGTRNYPVVQGTVLVVVALFVATNLAVDLAAAWLDPRVRQSLTGSA